ncbi:MAG TPA: response regulator [Pyrinomonadaceae bacterium]|nr:response regulator [Pyrinomonadaceae bacterium]
MRLPAAGTRAVMAVSARDALALAQREQFDLVISDIGVPEMDGYALAKSLRSLPEYASVPMVAITGFAQFDDRDRALAAGFNTHVKKPIDPSELVSLLKDLRK